MARARGQTKRAPRIDLRRLAVLVDADGRACPVTILDVSSGGFRVETAEAPRVGDLVTLKVEHGDEYPAQIRWALGSEAGGIFLSAVDAGEWEGRPDG